MRSEPCTGAQGFEALLESRITPRGPLWLTMSLTSSPGVELQQNSHVNCFGKPIIPNSPLFSVRSLHQFHSSGEISVPPPRHHGRGARRRGRRRGKYRPPPPNKTSSCLCWLLTPVAFHAYENEQQTIPYACRLWQIHPFHAALLGCRPVSAVALGYCGHQPTPYHRLPFRGRELFNCTCHSVARNHVLLEACGETIDSGRCIVHHTPYYNVYELGLYEPQGSCEKRNGPQLLGRNAASFCTTPLPC